MEENRRVKLYNNLINSGKVTESEIGTPEQFATALASKDKAIKFYGKVKDIFTPQEIGTEVDFLSFLEPDYIGQPTAPRQGAAAPFTGAVVGAQAAPQQPSGSQPTPQQQPPQAELAQAEVPQASPISNTMAMIDDFGREFVPSTPETPVPVNQAINTAEKALQQEFGSIIPEYDRIKSKMSSQESGVTAGSSPLAMAAIPLKSKLNKQERAFLSENKDAIQQIEDQRKAIFSAKQFEKISKNLDIYDYKRKHGANWAKRLMSATFNTGLLEDRLTMGVTEMVRNIDAGAVMLKASVGDKLSKAEEALLDSYTGYKGKSEQKRDFVFSAGQSLQVLPEFLLNIMGGNVAMGGLRAGLRASLGVMSKEALKGLGKRAVAKNIGRKLAESAIFNVIAIPTRTTFYKELSEQTIDPNRPLGGAVYESAMRTFWEYYAEEFSETCTGLGVGKYMGNKLFGKAIDDYAIRVGRIADKSWAKNITKAREMIQLGGVPIEMGEEIGTQLGNAVTLWSREDIEQLADPDFYKSVALSTVLMQGSFMGVAQGAKGVSGGVDRYRSSARLDKSIADVLAVENTSGGFIPQGVGRLTFMARNRRMKIADIEGWVKLANEATAQVEESDLSPERKESIKAGISKVIVAKAQKDGMATGLMSYMETESGVPFFNRKLDGKVVMGEAKDGKRYFILDQQQEQGKPGGNIYVVRDMEGETQEAFSGEFVNITTMEVEEFAQGWFEDHSNTVMAEQAMEGAEEISQEVEQKTSEPLTIDTVQPEMNVILAGQQMKVRRVSPIEIILEDSEGTIHHLDSEEAYTLTRVPEEVQAEVEQEVQGLMQGEEQPGQVMDVDPQEQPIGQEQPVEQVPLTEDGQPDYDRMAPDMLVRELSNDGFAEQEILDIVASTVETLGKEKATLEKKGAKTITEAAQKKKRIKEIDARIAELSAAMGLNTQPAINPQAEVQPQEQAQPTLQEQPQQASKTTRAQKDGVNNERMPTFREEVKALGDPMDAEEMVAFAIINNAKIRLSDKKDSKGFAKHMGISDSVEEKRKYIGIVRKDGMTPERFTEMLIETDEMNLLVGMGSIDVTDIVIDVVRNAYSKRSALNFIKAKREVGGDRALEQAYSGEITEWNLLQDIDDYYQEYYLSLTGEEHAQIQQLFIESAQQEQAFDDLMDMEDLPEDDIQDYGNRQSNRDAAENDQAGILGSVQQSDTGSNQEQGGDTAGVQASPEGQSGDVATGGQDTDLVQPQQDVAEKSPAMQALEQQRAEAVKERDRILKLASDRVGLFGDTKQDANDIFGGEGYDPAALQSLVDNQKALIQEIDRKIALQLKSEETGRREAQGQQEINDIAAEESKVNTNPTEAQKEAGNYQKGHVTIQGLEITIEQPKGSVRSGVDPDGKEWSITMNNTYGYALGTKSKDGDHIDIFLGDNPLSEKVFVVDQINKDKSFDEHKVMIGFDSIEDAKNAYLSNYEDGWQGLGNITETTMEQFKEWAKMEGRRIKPFVEYKAVAEAKEPTFAFMQDSPMQKARAITALSKGTVVEGRVMKTYEFLEGLENGLEVGKSKMYSSKSEKGYTEKLSIGDWIVNSKAEQDYYTYLQDGGKSYSEYLKEQKVYDNAIKEKAEAERKVRKEADAIKRKEQHAKSVSEKDSIIKEILQGKTEEQFLTEQLKRSRGYVESLRARKQTQDVISEIELEERNIKSKEKSLKFAYKSFKNLYKLSNGEVVEKYSYKPGDKITVDYGDGRVDNTEYVGSRENQDGSITHIVKPTEVLVNGYVGYDMISPIEESKTEVKEEGESESTPLKIEDYGEKIEGARKDQIKKYFDKINLNGQILSTIFPKPDIKGLIESGLSIKDVSGIKVAHEFATQDKKRGADVIRFYAAYAKNILAESINLEFNSGGYVFTEFGKSQIELRTKAYQQVSKELGDEYLQLDLTKVRISEMSEREVRSLVNKDISGKFKVQYYVSASKYFTTEEEAISAFTELVRSNTTKDTVEYKRKISVYQNRKNRDYYLGFQPKGKEFIKLSDNYKTSKEAFEYLKSNEADLHIELERIISEQKIGDKNPPVRLKFSNETTRDRVGKDWRGGRNIDSKEFAETFGFRGVEFGNWVNQKERQVFVNNSFDSLMDLAQLLNIPPKAISLSGQLGITFGSRGSGNAAAHYEPGRKIINLTKTQGLGSLAHEWYHAIDNYFAGFGTNITGMKSATESEFKPEVRDEVKKAFENLYRSLNTGTYKARSRNLDDSRSKNYYSLIRELSARAFENYILSRLNESGQVNDFIVNYTSVEDWNGEASKYPYPKAEESKVIYEAFNNLFETLDTKTDEQGNEVLYRSVELPETITIGGVEKSTTNSNGQPIAQTEEGIRKFWEWFSDSKVVDKQGRPLVVYHGSPVAGINKFDPEKSGENVQTDFGALFFTDNMKLAEDFSYERKASDMPGYDTKGSKGEVYPVYVKMENPFNLREVTPEMADLLIMEGAISAQETIIEDSKAKNKELVKNHLPFNISDLSKYGYDGIIGELNRYDGREYGVFEASQIKSVTSNTGEFSPESDDIRYKQPYFYSPTEQALNSIKQEKGTPDQWKAMLIKNGAKQAEMDWMGWDERFGTDHIDPKMTVGGQGVKLIITKSEIQEWINQNRIEVREKEIVDTGEIDMTELNSEGQKKYDELKQIARNWEEWEQDEYYGYDISNWQKEKIKEWEEEYGSYNYILDAEIPRILENPDNYIQETKRNTKYYEYQLPGGENYKELLLTMPKTETSDYKEYKEYVKALVKKYGYVYNESGTVAANWLSVDEEVTREEAQKYFDYLDKNDKESKSSFKSTHFDEPNILAHIRFNERTVNGERVLFIEEIQSDWAQKGREEGFKGDIKYKENNILKVESPEENQESNDWKVYFNVDNHYVFVDQTDAKTKEEAIKWALKWSNDYATEKELMPNMPFKNTDQWVNLALRRMMTYAAENGFDRIAWTNGEMQAARYDLSKQVDEIEYQKTNDKYDLIVRDKYGNPVIKGLYNESELEGIIGKEITGKIIRGEGKAENDGSMSLTGVDLKVGGSGMKAFYDNIIPAQANKIGKKFGAKVGAIDMPITPGDVYNADTEEIRLTPEAEEVHQSYMDAVANEEDVSISDYVSEMDSLGYEVVLNQQGEPIDLKKKYTGETARVQSIPITDAIREQAEIGMPLYKAEHNASNPLKPGKEFNKSTDREKYAYASEFANALGVKVRIVSDVSQIPASSVKMRRAKGWFNQKTGEVTVVLPNHTSFEDIQSTILHEVVAHKGLRGLLGGQFNSTMEKVFDSMSKPSQADYLSKYGDRVVAAEEYVAEIAEKNQDPTLWEKIKGLIRDAFRGLGVDLSINDSDIRYLLWRSKNRLKNANNATIAEVASDIHQSERMRNSMIVESLEKDNIYDFMIRVKESLSLPITRDYFSFGGDGVLRIKDHNPNWSNFVDDMRERNAKKFVNVTIGDFSAANMRRWRENQTTIDEIREEYPDIEFVDIIIEEGDSVADAVDKIRKAIAKDAEYEAQAQSEAEGPLFRVADMLPIDTNDITLGWIDRSTIKVQDRMLAVKRLQEEVKRRGGSVRHFANPYATEALSISKATYATESFMDRMMKPAENIITEWVKRGVDDIDRWHYMVAKHAPERNQRIVGDEVAAFIPNSINKKISILKDKHLAEENEAKQVELMGQISQQTALLEFVRNPRYKAVILDMIRYKHSEIFGSKPKRNDALYDDLTTLEYAMLSKIGEMAESKLERVGRTEQTDNRSGFTTQDAIEFVSEFEGKVDNQKEIDDFWGYVKAATRFSLEKSYQHGLLSQEYYERVSSMYEYYVPLRDWEVKENVDYSSIVGRSFESKGIVNVVNKTAKGRSSMSSDPLAQIASMAESAAIWGEKNEVRMAAWRMITENKEMTDLFEIRESWMVNVGEVDGDTQWVQTFDPPTKQMKEAGLAKKGKPNDSYRWHKTNKELEEHEVPVYIDGEYIMMYFKGDIGARVASAINNTAGQDEIGRVMRFTGSATRTMAALATSKNPDFMLTNFVRDYLFGVNAYFIRGGNPAALTANIPIAWKVITQMYSSKAVADTGLKQMYEAFREYGGETGWVHMLGIEKQRKKIEKIVKEAEQAHTISPTLAMRKAYNGLNDALDYLAEMSENAMRFAAFKAEVDKYVKRTGKNPSREAYEKAAIAAKELTTNFNRKGEWAQSVNALYAFANASVQGTANLVSLFKENPARALVSTMTTLMLTVIGPMLIYSVGGDDEKQTYDEMSPYVKDNYFVFPGFGDGKLITIAKPHGFRAITSIGTLMIDGIRNGQEPERVLGDWFKNMLTEVSPFNLVGIDKSPLIIPESIPQFMLTATPTALRPLAEVAFNMNFLGNTIEREHVLSSQEGYLPQYLKAKSNTNPIMVGISKTLNNALGGTDDISARYKYNPETQEVEESALRALGDISPAQVEHLFEGYLGGLGRFFNDAFKTTRSVARGEVPETSNVPVVRRFYQGAWGNPAMDHYYQTKKRVRLMEMYVKAFTKNGQQEDVIGLLNFRNSQVMAIHNQYDKMIKETLKDRDKFDPKSDIYKRLDENIDYLFQQHYEQIKKIDSRHEKGK